MTDDIRPLFPKTVESAEDAASLVIGTIFPAADAEAPPFVIRKNDPKAPVGCDHASYVLHERWQTVTCADCGAELSPFAVLQRYGEFYERVVRERQRLYSTHAGALVEQLRALLPRVALSAADRTRIMKIIDSAQHRVYTEALAWIREATALRDDMQRKVWDAQHERRAAKRTRE